MSQAKNRAAQDCRELESAIVSSASHYLHGILRGRDLLDRRYLAIEAQQARATLFARFDMNGAFPQLVDPQERHPRILELQVLTDPLMKKIEFASVVIVGIDHPDGLPIYGDTFYVTDPGTGELRFIPRGTAGRTDWVLRLDLSAIYSFNWGDRAQVELRAEVFNLLNAQSVTEVYEFAETSIGIPDPRLHVPQVYQRPRYMRFGATLRF